MSRTSWIHRALLAVITLIPTETAIGRPDGADRRDLADRRARNAVIGERFLSADAGRVIAEGATLPVAERFAYLADWVLPGPDHGNVRLYGLFTPTDPAPPVATVTVEKGRRVATGGRIDAPAMRLVAAAQELGKLDDLAARMETLEARSDRDRRDRLALLALVRMAQGRDAEAEAALKGLKPLLATIQGDDPVWTRWAELIAATEAQGRPALRPSALDLLNEMVEAIQRHNQYGPFPLHVRSARGRGLVWNLTGPPEAFDADPESDVWARVTIADAGSRGQGYPLPRWTARDGELKHYPGHRYDHLYFRTPFRGDVEIEGELTSFNWREARLSYAALALGVVYDLKHAERIEYGRSFGDITIDPPLPPLGDWYPFKIVVQGNTYTAYAAGRKIHEQPLPPAHDPWLAVFMRPELNGGFRNLTIRGKPVVPESLDLSGLPELTGWSADYYGELLTGDRRAWEKRGEEIVGRRSTDPPSDLPGRYDQRPTPEAIAGSMQESILQYHRPMLEDGTITYEFFYDPERALVHPALDRLTFLIGPDGVKIHWMTDAQYDRTGLAPDNALVEATNRRGPAKLPLRERGWNRVKLDVAGDVAKLLVNDILIYERIIEPTNQRNFGLFHYADATEARVRNVRYRGDWPKELPILK